MRLVPRTDSSPGLQAMPGLPQRLTPAASASLCHPSGASTPPPAARPARVDLPPHRTHAVAREHPSAFSAAAASPPLAVTASHASLLSLYRPTSPGTEPHSSTALERASSDWPWGSSRMPGHSSIPAIGGSAHGATACTGLQGQHESGSGGLQCRRSAADKELAQRERRKAAADTAMARMKNMEAQSLSGLDAFSLQSCMPSKPGKPGTASLVRSSMY